MKSTVADICRQPHSLLLVVDIQTRVIAAMPGTERDTVIAGSGRLMRAAGLLDIPTVITEQYPSGLGPTDPAVLKHSPPVCERIEKTAFSARGVKAFDQLLAMSDRSQVIICGVETHVCVLQSALRLQRDGFTVFVAADAVGSRSPANRDIALARMARAGVIVSNVESIICEWLGDSTHPAFREISALLH